MLQRTNPYSNEFSKSVKHSTCVCCIINSLENIRIWKLGHELSSVEDAGRKKLSRLISFLSMQTVDNVLMDKGEKKEKCDKFGRSRKLTRWERERAIS